MRFLGALAVSLSLGLLPSCGGDLALPTESLPTTLAPVAGDGQRGTVAQRLSESIAVRLLDQEGRPVSGIEIGFALGSGATGGAVTPASVETDADGRAAARWTLGRTAGAQRLDATAVGLGLSTQFRATAAPAPAQALGMLAGDGQSGVVGFPLPESLVVQAVDRFGNPVAGVSVEWAADRGSVSPARGLTGVDGRAAARRTLGPAAGPQHATASASGLDGSPITFSQTAVAGGPTRLELVSGDGQRGAAGVELAQPLVVRLLDGEGNGIPGAAVAWVADAGNGSPSLATSSTDTDGLAVTRWTLGSGPGSQSLSAVVSGVGVVIFSATLEGGPAGTLAFLVQPAEVHDHKSITPAVQVASPVPDVTVRIELLAADGAVLGKELHGKTTRPAEGGIAVFDDLSVHKSDTGYRLRASVPERPELGSVLSDRFDVAH